MIYAELNTGQKLIILEPGNFDRLRVGKVATTPDNAIVIAFTPDIRYTAEEFEKAVKAGQMDGARFHKIMLESLKRAEVHEREQHPLKQIIGNGEVRQ